MNISVLYVGSSLLSPLKQAEHEINLRFNLDLRVAAHNFGMPLSSPEWEAVERDLGQADLIFVIHVMDGENASRLIKYLDDHRNRHDAVVVINCMPDLMRRTRMGDLAFEDIFKPLGALQNRVSNGISGRAVRLAASVGNWVGEQTRAGRSASRGHYLRLVDRLPQLLRFVPSAGRLRDVKHYLYLFCYFIQPAPGNIRSMLLYALKHYVKSAKSELSSVRLPAPEKLPSAGIYHPDASELFSDFSTYEKWYRVRAKEKGLPLLSPDKTVGLLLMRPQIVSGSRKHYDGLIRQIEDEGLPVLPVISTFMDNREACGKFFLQEGIDQADQGNGEQPLTSRVSQIVSLTGFSFVGGPAMNDSQSSVSFLRKLNVPFRSAISLDTQTIESWLDSQTGLNPVQTGMQVAIPEVDGATEPFIFGGMPSAANEPIPLEDRCQRLARRLGRWNRLQTEPRSSLRIALVLFSFPPNKGNLGTAADLDVFPSVLNVLRSLKSEGYAVDVPKGAGELRHEIIGGNSDFYGSPANVLYRMKVDEYRRLCPYVQDVEGEWGTPPGEINSYDGELVLLGIDLGNVTIAVQPGFGYEGDPMRMMMAKGGAPNHAFMALYTYLEKIFKADAVVHVGTHGALEFMPGKQVGLSSSCWPDRLIGELPHFYIYSVNNPSEGTIAKRRAYGELISYLTPPIENAGLYKDLASLKELLNGYGQISDESERAQLYSSIEEKAAALNL